MFRSNRVAQIPPYMFAEIKKKKEEMVQSGIDVIDLGMGDPEFQGCREFREAVADYYQRHFQVELDPETEVLALIGSKEGIAHLANGRYYDMPLREGNGYLPDFASIPQDVREQAKLMFLNYPNNPTTAVADLDFFERAVQFARQHQTAVANDSAYNMVAFHGYRLRTAKRSKLH
ncbi:aminotransferase class I/II-fold pyridoxal phosphate-dependent enzyme [Brevibacillus sp. B_LB10_24]|uniref:aminotransferase class I/II-fold pyridoxal phosphate-dependent enzyme n=1 Tax=Brevibacillus sp. B_LB10_24 TaxID=3380645 RepID=UPI0038B88982